MTPAARHYGVAVLLLALGFAMRAFGAWVYEYALTSDHGIVCLMVKHIVGGGPIPVFYYGQGYLGALEPLVSAACCAIFGVTGFWVNMGTALTAFAFLPLVYAWGRGAGGKTAGLAALAFCVIGPPYYFQFVSWAYGGYAAILLLTCALLVYSVRLLTRDLEGSPPGYGSFALLGLLAGLGWWQSPLLIPALLVCGLLFLAVMRKRLISFRPLAAVAGFMLGSLPLWIWNWGHGWETFHMLKTRDAPALLEGLRLFYTQRLVGVMDFDRRPDFTLYLVGLLIVLVLVAVVRLAVACRRPATRAQALYLGAAFLYLAVYSVLFGRSRFARVDALRYVLILIPVMAVPIGVATAWLTERVRFLGWLPLVVLIGLQAAEMPMRLTEREFTASFVPQARKLADFLRETGIKHLYTDYQVRRANHGLNFLLNEEFVFSPVSRERYRPYAVALETSANPAVLNNTMGFSSFLKTTGASCRTNEVEGMLVQYGARPTAGGWRALAGAEPAAIEQGKGASMIIRRWPAAVPVNGFRLVCEPECYPAVVGAEAWDEAGQTWKEVVPDAPVTRYFWSGPRFYWGGSDYRFECRFAPVETTALRVRVKPARTEALRVLDLLPMAPGGGGKEPGAGDIARLADWIRSNGVKRVYADRWESVQLAAATEPGIALSLPPRLFDRPLLPAGLSLGGDAVLAVRESEAALLRNALNVRHVPFLETSLTVWVLFHFQGALPPHAADPGLQWAGWGCFPTGDRGWSLRALETIRAAQAAHEETTVKELAAAAAALNPGHRPLLEAQVACLQAAGMEYEAEALRSRAAAVWTPGIPLKARFRGGVELAGVTFDGKAARGGSFAVKLIWRIPPGTADGLACFIQFRREGRILFQDIRPLPVELAAGLEAGDLAVETRSISIPEEVGAGQVHVEMGLMKEGDRVKVQAETSRSGKSVTLPMPLVID